MKRIEKLGKLPPIADARDFRAMELLPAKLPKVPTRFGHGYTFTAWGMLGNGPDDTVAKGFKGCGDCVFAGGAHETMIVNKTAGRIVKFTGRNAVDDYSAVTGYHIGDDSSDNGTVVKIANGYRRHTGLIDADGKRHKIGAYLTFDPQDWEKLMVATYYFDYVGIGFEFPSSAWEDWDAGVTWDHHDMDSSSIDGGHYVPIIGRPRADVCTFVTWGKRATMTRQFYEEYNDESWAMISPESLRRGKNDRGLDLTHLNSLLRQLT
jgi:hypothetical protein